MSKPTIKKVTMNDNDAAWAEYFLRPSREHNNNNYRSRVRYYLAGNKVPPDFFPDARKPRPKVEIQYEDIPLYPVYEERDDRSPEFTPFHRVQKPTVELRPLYSS